MKNVDFRMRQSCRIMKSQSRRHTYRGRLLLIGLYFSVFICGYVFASDYPSWWTNRNVIINTASTNDWAAANLGQLKWFATNAYDELESKLPGGAGTNISVMVSGFSLSNNEVAINIGQLKNVSAPFWSRLIEINYTNSYPWTTNTTADDKDYSAANIGQLKNVFSFELAVDSDSDSLPDWWEMSYFGNYTHGALEDTDGDGLNNLVEFQNNTNPSDKDTDNDQLIDWIEVKICKSDPTVADTDGDGLSDYTEITYNSELVCWGTNNYGQTNVPIYLSNVVSIAAGDYHSMALNSNGQVFCWGANYYGQTNVPSGLSNVVSIAAGGHHNMAMKSDGQLVCWGNNSYGQTNVPSGLSSVVSIAAGMYHSMALASDGQVFCWGWNNYGQTNVPSGLSNVVSIAAGFYHSMALKSDGQLVCWGNNSYGQTNVPSGLSNVIAIAAGGYHNMALSHSLSPLSPDTDGDGVPDCYYSPDAFTFTVTYPTNNMVIP